MEVTTNISRKQILREELLKRLQIKEKKRDWLSERQNNLKFLVLLQLKRKYFGNGPAHLENKS